MKAEKEIYLLSVRMLSAISEANIPDVGFKKAIMSLQNWANRQSKIAEGMNSDVHARAVHNFNIIINSIDEDILAIPIGELTIEK